MGQRLGIHRPQEDSEHAASSSYKQRTFYLVQGGPPIRYTGPGEGPLILDIDGGTTEDAPEHVEHSQSIRNLASIHEGAGVTLVANAPPQSDYTINFSFVAYADVSVTAHIYIDVSVSTVAGEGFVMKRKSDGRPAAPVASSAHPSEMGTHLPSPETPTADAGSLPPPRRVETRVESVSVPIAAKPTVETAMPTEAAVVVWLEYVTADDKLQGLAQRCAHITVCSVPRDHSPLAPNLVATHRFLQTGTELFQLQDIFDAGSGEPGDTVEEADEDSHACVICLTNPKNTTVLPCRHLCLCGECAGVLRHQTSKCPLCRTTIEKLMTMEGRSTPAPGQQA